MKTMIVVRGSHDTGKTRSIQKVYETINKLRERYKSLEITELKSAYCEHNGDFKAIFEYKGKKIGIESIGNYCVIQKEWLADLANADCDIIVCASYLGGKAHDYVLDIKEKYDYNFYWVISQMICLKGDPLYDTWDEYIAKGIVKLIDELI
jgi:hypothetical protein